MIVNPLQSVRARLMWTMAVIVGGLVLALSLVFTLQQGAALEGALVAKADGVGRLAAYSVAAGLEFDDDTMVAETFDGVISDKEVAYIALKRANGTLVSEKGTKPTAAGDFLHVELPVQTKNAGNGTLIIDYSRSGIEAQKTASQAATFGSGLVVFLFGLAFIYVIATLISNPIQEMARISSHIATGRLDIEPPALAGMDEIGDMARAFRHMLQTLKTLEAEVLQVAAGNLTRDSAVEGDLAAAFNRMLAAQRSLVRQIAETSSDIGASSSQILATSLQLEQTASEQASVVEETLRTMETLLQSANQISDVSTKVLENAERTHDNSQMIAERITELAGHTHRISGFLEVIKDIANKTDLLALNAALEGTRAGEAGRGFSLVASQMQRLTVNVMDAVEDIKGLTADIREATTSSVLATEDATKRALSTEQSARQINLIIQQQQSGTEQVSNSMGEISEAIRQSVAASAQSAQSATELSELAARLQTRVHKFQLDS